MFKTKWIVAPAVIAAACMFAAGCSHSGSNVSPATQQAVSASNAQTAVSQIQANPNLTPQQKMEQAAAAQRAMNIPPRMIPNQAQ